MQPYMPEETLKRMMLLENRIAELKELHKDCLSVIESQDERIAEQDLLLAQWESIDELNRERSQQRLQRIAELEAVLPELCVDCYQIYYDMVEAESEDVGNDD